MLALWTLISTTAWAGEAALHVAVDVVGVPETPLDWWPPPRPATPAQYVPGQVVVTEDVAQAVVLTGAPVAACTCSTVRLACETGAAGVRVQLLHAEGLTEPLVGYCRADEQLLAVEVGRVLAPEPFEVGPGAWVVPHVDPWPEAGIDILFLPRKAGWSMAAGSPCTLARAGRGAPWVVTLATPTPDALDCLLGPDGPLTVRTVRFRPSWTVAATSAEDAAPPE